jgi:hypothetical protein
LVFGGVDDHSCTRTGVLARYGIGDWGNALGQSCRRAVSAASHDKLRAVVVDGEQAEETGYLTGKKSEDLAGSTPYSS